MKDFHKKTHFKAAKSLANNPNPNQNPNGILFHIKL
jgi:hypothetical protein